MSREHFVKPYSHRGEFFKGFQSPSLVACSDPSIIANELESRTAAPASSLDDTGQCRANFTSETLGVTEQSRANFSPRLDAPVKFLKKESFHI